MCTLSICPPKAARRLYNQIWLVTLSGVGLMELKRFRGHWSLPMKRMKREVSREGTGSSPPRFASEALTSAQIPPHQVEQDVRNVLLAQPNLHFSSLVVRR